MKQQFVSFDWVIKYMLRDKTNYVIVDGFLSELLKQPIQIQEILESESNKTTGDDKYNRVDALVKNQHGELILIELQYKTEYDFFHRILYGTSKLITEYLKEGEAYAKIKKVISVSIVYFDLGKGDDYLYHGTTTFHGLHKNDSLQLTKAQKLLYHCQTPAEIYPEYYLIKIEKFADKVNDTLDEWVYFFKNETILDSFTAQGLTEAKEKLNVLKLPDEERQIYRRYSENRHYQKSMEESERWEVFFQGEKAGYQRAVPILEKAEAEKQTALEKAQRAEMEKRAALEKAEAEKRVALEKAEAEKQAATLRTAKQLLQANVDIAIIMQVTGLDKISIENLP
jgi:predicted transposase/invertase (TIGR01784 family)